MFCYKTTTKLKMGKDSRITSYVQRTLYYNIMHRNFGLLHVKKKFLLLYNKTLIMILVQFIITTFTENIYCE